MHKKTLAEIVSSLREVAEQATAPGDGEFQNFQLHDGLAYSLTNEAALKFSDQIAIFLKNKEYSEKFSEKYITDQIKKIFAEILQDKDVDAENKLLELTQEFDTYDVKRQVYLRVDGLNLQKDIELGRVFLCVGSDYLIERILNDSNNIVKTVEDGDNKNNYFSEHLKAAINGELKGRCVARVEMIAETQRAYERAKEEVRRVIDILRFASKAIYPLSEDIRIGLVGDHPYSKRKGFVFSETQLSMKNDSIGSVCPFEITDASIKKMEKVGVFKLSEILRKKQPSQFEETLLRSVHWFSVALTQNEIENAFLCLIIALETLFTQEQGNPISNSVAEFAALILADKLEIRKNIKTRIKDYYGKRSGVAHGGKKTISKVDCYNLINIVGTTIMILADKTKEFSSQTELVTWVEDMKFSS